MTPFLPRRLAPTLERLARGFPVSFAAEDPRGFLARFREGAVFDEAKRWPDLFSHLQGLVDADRVPGRFVLAGSQQFKLMACIGQSLAGRVGVTRLLPLALEELQSRPDLGEIKGEARQQRVAFEETHLFKALTGRIAVAGRSTDFSGLLLRDQQPAELGTIG